LEGLPGVGGIVLGGSRARGTNRPDSDIDIGIYYNKMEFNIDKINEAARILDDEHRPSLVSDIGAWGAWINGGGWLKIGGYHVDFIFRDIQAVDQVIEACLEGNITSNYQTGHPHAFLNVMYMGEIALCNILADSEGAIAALKEKTMPYPTIVQETLINYFMFEARFSYLYALDNVGNEDVYYITGHVFRVISCLNQVLFALNKAYCINEKRAVNIADKFALRPVKYKYKVNRIVTLLSSNPDKIRQSVDILKVLIDEVDVLIHR